MRLTSWQKQAVLQSRPGSTLVRLPGKQWGAVWFDGDMPRRERWRGQLVKEVRARPDTGGVSDLDGRPCDVWFSGSEQGGATRRSVVQALHAEAQL